MHRNTIVASAPVAELAIASPEKYGELVNGFSMQLKLQTFVLQCINTIDVDPAPNEGGRAKKKSREILPFLNRKK